MEKQFFEYYKPSEEEFNKLWKEALFVFDANVLLNLYKYSEDTRNELMKILEKISTRIWIPYQFALEYQKNRLKEIRRQEKSYQEINDKIQQHINDIKKELEIYSKHPLLDVKDIGKEVQKKLENIQKKIMEDKKKKHPNWLERDDIREKLTKLFTGKVSNRYNNKKLKEIYKEGKKRFSKETPPGFKDDKKDKSKNDDEKKYGDLVGWFQIIDKAKESKKSIIFITDDKKDDWWYIDDGTLGPRPELIREIYDKTHVHFYMYTVDRFIEYAKKQFNMKIDTKTINEAKEVREYSEEYHPSMHWTGTLPKWEKKDYGWVGTLSGWDKESSTLSSFGRTIFKDKLRIGEKKSYKINDKYFEIRYGEKGQQTLAFTQSVATFYVNERMMNLLIGQETHLYDVGVKIKLISLDYDNMLLPYAEIMISTIY